MLLHKLLILPTLLLCSWATLQAAGPSPDAKLVPDKWDPALAGDLVMERLINTNAPQVKGAHDAEMIIVGDRAYIVVEVNDVRPGESADWPEIYVTMSIVNLKTLALEKTIPFARSEQIFENVTLPRGACFVPRILQKDEKTLRCYFASEEPGKRQAQTWFIDFDIASMTFGKTIEKAKIKTAAGVFDMQPQYLYQDAATGGFKKPPFDFGLYLFDSFKKFDGKTYVALNNYPGAQNALAVVNDALDTFEVLGHYNGPDALKLTESAVNRLPDGTWMAICRQEGGSKNYIFSTSKDGKTWTTGAPLDFVPNGTSSKPTFDKFGDSYYLGWQEATKINGVGRSVFNIDISRDGKNWERKYRFETPKSFQYPTFREHNGEVWLCVTQGDTDASRKERIMFGKLEDRGAFESQAGKKRKPLPPKPWAENNGEKLYNGIVLPEVWPPQHLDSADPEPMAVPYLQHPPKVISIDVGRQLFVDDFLIENSTLQRHFHQAKKYEGNPVFKAETMRELAPSPGWEPGEKATTFLGQGGVFYDPSEKLFKMFYVAGWRGPLSLATSTDMIHWTRPDLGLAGGNALLPEGSRWTGAQLKTGGSDNCVWLDLNATKPSERLKFMTCWLHVPKEQRPPGFNHSLHVSDGRTWSDAAPTGMADDYCSFFFNPFRQMWCYSIKQGGPRGRSRSYSENTDFLKGADWSKSVHWTHADRLDAPEPEGRYPGAGEASQLYSLNAVAYESVMIGMHYIHRGPKNDICDKGKFPKLLDLELGFSRDGFHWDRQDRRGFILGSRTEGSWDRAYLHGTAGVFVVLNDQLVFPYMGTSGIAPDGSRGMYTGGSIGLAMLRRDGFASLDAGTNVGTLTTRPVVFNGSHLFVNLNAPAGELRVEVLDETNKIIATSQPIGGDKTKQRITWQNQSDLSAFSGRPVRFRFHLSNGQLYAFWVTPDHNGASNGYVAAGGPEFAGVRDAWPVASK